MAYDPDDADLMRADIGNRDGLSEKKMFGGMCFFIDGNMLCGVTKTGGMFRVGKDNEPEAVTLEGVSPMIHSGRRMGGFVYLDRDAFEVEDTRATLMAMALQNVSTLPPKSEGA